MDNSKYIIIAETDKPDELGYNRFIFTHNSVHPDWCPTKVYNVEEDANGIDGAIHYSYKEALDLVNRNYSGYKLYMKKII